MNILITGGCGNLGSRLLMPLIQRGDRVVLFDLQRRPRIDSPQFARCQFVAGDLADADALLHAVGAHEVQSIFHLGAILSADAEDRPQDAWAANMIGTRNVLEAARRSGARQVVFSSTVATYGANLPEPLAQDAPQWPLSLYGACKVAGERLGFYYEQRFGLDFRAVRFPAVVGPQGASGGASAFVSALFKEAVGNGQYTFYLEPSTRCPLVYVADAVAGLVKLHEALKAKLTRNVYNVAGWAPSAQELASLVAARLPEAIFRYEPDPLQNAIVNSWPDQIDDRVAREDWGWDAQYDLDRMADEMIRVLGGRPG